MAVSPSLVEHFSKPSSLVHMLFYRESALDVLLLLEQYQSDVYAVKRCLTEIARHLRDTPTSGKDLHVHNFVPRLCSCLQPYTTNFTIISCLCLLLRRLFSLGVTHHSSVVTSGLWKVVVDAMKHDSGNVNLFEMGCALTSALCLERSGVAHGTILSAASYAFSRVVEANQIEMVQSGVLDMLCVAMQTNNQLASIDAIHGLLVALLFAAGTADRALKSDLPQLFSMGLHSFFKDAAVVTALAQVLFQLHVASPQPAKDVFCAKEMPFHLVTIFEDVITAVSQRRSGGGGASSAAFLSFVSAVIFSHVAIMTNVSTSSTCGIVTHPARVQMLMKASVHTFAVSSLTQFPKVIPVSRYGDAYSWAQVYAALKQRYVDGKLSPEGWTQIDAAYDILYDPHVRRAHDGWGPDFQVQLQKDMLFNVALFYMLWAVGVFIATAGRKYQSGRDLAVAALLVVRYQKLAKTSIWECMWFVWQTLVFEVSVRFFSYDPRLTLLSQATPFELVMALHIIFPASLLGYTSYKRLLFVDMLKHRHDCLSLALRTNEETKLKLRELSVAATAAADNQIGAESKLN
ncbi:hypothetical protein DYB25_007862 [Aphanomyces astaci]|uniref:Uncharacterized protein n=1 Tax=Aphanomyces astaci TaxID=112090 RepID=A0A397ANK3_APHAT|nr:hypothetical protein DYB25_007862 [Aphanomyces astaci]